MRDLGDLHTAIAAVAPITGVQLLDRAAKTVAIQFQASATAQQRTDAQTVVTTFDWSDTAGNRAASLKGLDDAMVLKALTIAIFQTLKAKNPVVQLPTLAEVRTAFVNAIHAGQAD